MRHGKTLPLLLSLLSGCSLIPAYQRPALARSARNGRQAPAPRALARTPGQAAADIGWRDFFADPALQGLIALSPRQQPGFARGHAQRGAGPGAIPRGPRQPVSRCAGLGGLDAARTPADLSPLGVAENSHEYSLGVGRGLMGDRSVRQDPQPGAAAQETYLSDADTALLHLAGRP